MLEDEQRMQICALGLLHRMARAAGGTLSIKIDEIPEKLPFNFRVTNGVAVFTALEKPRPTIIAAPASTLKM